MGSQNRITTVIDIQADVANAKKNANELAQYIRKMDYDPDISKNAITQLHSIERELEKIESRTDAGEIELFDGKKSEQDIHKIQQRIAKIYEEVGKQSGTPLIKDDANILKQMKAARDQYQASIEAEANKESELIKKVEMRKQKLEEMQKAKDKFDKAEANVNKKIAGSGGKYSSEQLNEEPGTGSHLKKTKVYKEEYAPAKAELDKTFGGADPDQAIKEMEKSVKQAQGELNKFNTETKELESNKAFEKMKQDIEKIDPEKLKRLGIDPKTIKSQEDLDRAIEKVTAEANKAGGEAAQKFKSGMEKMEQSADKTEKEIREANETMRKTDDAMGSLENLKSRISYFVGLEGAVQLARTALRDAMQTVKELDKTMTEMAVVTDLGVGDYWQQLPEYSARAKELGVSINSAYEAATLYYQQGLKTNEVVAISNETLKMARIAGLSAEDATNKMTAALRGFNMELNETSAQKVADVYSKLAAITASDTKEISSAMTKTASIASNAGMEFETTAAFLSQIIETTRESAETAGTAMKTVIARFQELKKDPAEIGEVDGEVVDANKIETALRSVGVALRDANGQFRDLDDVFLELASKWDKLDTNTQRYIATIAAGSRQQSRFIAMMSDYRRTQELVNAANNSAGASQEQFNKTLEGLEAKLERLNTAWHEFTMGIANNEVIKLGVDLATKLLEIINNLTSAVSQAAEAFGGSANAATNFADSIIKIAGVLGMFQLAKILFKKLEVALINHIKNARIGAENEINKSKHGPVGKISKKTNKNGQTYYTDEKNHFAKKSDYEAQQAEQANAWKKTTTNIGMTVSVIGLAITLMGTLLEKFNLISPAAAKVVKAIGGIVTVLGAVIALFPMIIAGIKSITAAMASNPYLLAIMAIIAALAIVIAMIAGIANTIKKHSIEEKIKKAEKATKEAEEAANKAKEAYDKLFDQKDKYDQAQKSLEDLTEGTREWRKALIDVNNQVLELLKTYPQLQKYITRDGGRLTISEEGWDKILEDQEKAMKNAQLGTLSAQTRQQNLQMQAQGTRANKELLKDNRWEVWTDADTAAGIATLLQVGKLISPVGVIIAAAAGIWLNTSRIQKQTAEDQAGLAADIRNFTRQSFENEDERWVAADEIAKKWGVATDKVLEYSDAIAPTLENQLSNAINTLTAVASDELTNSGFGSALIEALGESVVSGKEYQRQVDEMAGSIYKDDKKSEWENNKVFQDLANEYNLADEMQGDDLKDMQKLYAAVMGISVEDIGDGLKKDKKEMAKRIAETKVQQDMLEKAEETALKLEAMDDRKAQEIAGWTSQAGGGMSFVEAQAIGSSGNTRAYLEKQLEDTGLTLEQLAQSLGKSVEEFVKEVESNAEEVEKNRERTFGKYKKYSGGSARQTWVNKDSDAIVSASVEAALAEKMAEIAIVNNAVNNEANQKELYQLEYLLDRVINETSIGQNQVVQKYLTSMNWSDTKEWEGFADLLEEQEIELDSTIETFIVSAMDMANAMEKIDFESLTKKINESYDMLQRAQRGELTRTFSKEDYEDLIANRGIEKKDFVQLGDNFYYLGASLERITDVLYEGIGVAGQIMNQEKNRQTWVEIMSNYTNPLPTDQAGKEAWLEGLATELISKGYMNDPELVSNLGLGLNNDSLYNIAGLAESEKFNELIEKIIGFKGQNKELSNDAVAQLNQLYAVRDIFGITSEGQTKIVDEAGVEDSRWNQRAALAIWVEQSGLFSQEIMDAYNAMLVEADYGRGNEGIEFNEDFIKTEELFIKELRKFTTNQKAAQAKQDLVQQTYDALVEQRQKEIDKLSSINDSINEARQDLVSKIQEQIDDQRKARENEKTEQELSDKQIRLAYLMRDTSGGHDLEILQLQKEIAESEEDYVDSLIDQSIEKLQDANEEAAEQRQKQIDLLTEQLDQDEKNGSILLQAQNMVEESVKQTANAVAFAATTVGALLKGTDAYKNMTPEQQVEFDRSITQLAADASSTSTSYSGGTDSGFTADTDVKTDAETGAQEIVTSTKAANNIISSVITQGQTGIPAKKIKGEPIETGFSFSKANNLYEYLDTRTGQMQYNKWAYLRSKVGADSSKQAFIKEVVGQLDASGGLGANLFNPETGDLYSKEMSGEIQSDSFGIKARHHGFTYSSANQKQGDPYFEETDDEVKYEFQGTTYTLNFQRGNFTRIQIPEDNIAKGAGGFEIKDSSQLQLPDGVLFGSVYSDKNLRTEETEYWLNYFDPSITALKETGISDLNPSPSPGELTYYKGTVYLYDGNYWQPPANINDKYKESYNNLIGALQQYKTGGLADFTGPAWLDGTKSKPEMVLNQRDTANFIQLKDILAEIMSSTSTIKQVGDSKGGDNYYDIEISVDKLENDYDVEQLASKIKTMIYDDSVYRNVNSINHIR